MEVCTYLVADPESFELVEPGEGSLDDPAGLAESGAVKCAASGDLGRDPAGADQTPVFVEVVAAVREEPARPVTRPSAKPADAGYRVEQWHELGDVVPVSAGQGDGEWGSVPVDDEVVLAARAGTVDRRRSGVSPPLRARTCEESIAASSMSSSPPARSPVRRTSWSRGHTPASVQSRSRRQAVTPPQPTRSAGTSRQLTPLHST